jgi:hypothetical protein
LRLSTSERKKEEHVALVAILFNQRQNSRHRRGADIVEQDKDIILFHQTDSVPNGGFWIVTVIVCYDLDFSPKKAALLVHGGDKRRTPPKQLNTQAASRTAERGGHSNLYLFAKGEFGR